MKNFIRKVFMISMSSMVVMVIAGAVWGALHNRNLPYEIEHSTLSNRLDGVKMRLNESDLSQYLAGMRGMDREEIKRESASYGVSNLEDWTRIESHMLGRQTLTFMVRKTQSDGLPVNIATQEDIPVEFPDLKMLGILKGESGAVTPVMVNGKSSLWNWNRKEGGRWVTDMIPEGFLLVEAQITDSELTFTLTSVQVPSKSESYVFRMDKTDVLSGYKSDL